MTTDRRSWMTDRRTQELVDYLRSVAETDRDTRPRTLAANEQLRARAAFATNLADMIEADENFGLAAAVVRGMNPNRDKARHG